MKIIDAHCVIGDPGRGGAAPGVLLENMRRNNVAKAIIVADDACAAVDNEEGNRTVLNAVEKHQSEFIGFATVNPWYGKKAAEMLRTYVSRGLCGLYFKSTVQGFMPDDKMLFPLLDICEEHSLPVYFHTGTPVNALPFSVMAQAQRYKKVNFILGHMGANDYVGDAYAAAAACDNIYLETSLNLTLLIRGAVQKRSERVLFGSGSPRSCLEFELKKVREAVPQQATLNMVLFGNIERILGGQK